MGNGHRKCHEAVFSQGSGPRNVNSHICYAVTALHPWSIHHPFAVDNIIALAGTQPQCWELLSELAHLVAYRFFFYGPQMRT